MPVVAAAILDGAEKLALEIAGERSIGIVQGSKSSLCRRWLCQRGTGQRAAGAVPPRKGRLCGSKGTSDWLVPCEQQKLEELLNQPEFFPFKRFGGGVPETLAVILVT